MKRLFLLLLLLSVLNLANCSISVYHNDETKKYVRLEDGVTTTIYITKHNYILLEKRHNSMYDFAIYKIVSGSSANGVFGFYNVSQNDLAKIRSFKGAKEVWKIEMKIIHKGSNTGRSSFGDIGKRYNEVLVIRENSIKIGSVDYEQIEMSEKERITVERINNKTIKQ